MADKPDLICGAADLVDGGDGVRFEVDWNGSRTPAFAVRFRGRVHAWLNRCARIALELDWMPGRFFDDSGLYLICATHGAVYCPDSGQCVGGPCRGASLTPVPVVERDGAIYIERSQT
jgi:nitrite reductase/ring-hydroxylating ferredoxin subunit